MKLSKLALLSVAVVMGGILVSCQKKTQERRVVPPAVVTEFTVDEMMQSVCIMRQKRNLRKLRQNS